MKHEARQAHTPCAGSRGKGLVTCAHRPGQGVVCGWMSECVAAGGPRSTAEGLSLISELSRASRHSTDRAIHQCPQEATGCVCVCVSWMLIPGVQLGGAEEKAGVAHVVIRSTHQRCLPGVMWCARSWMSKCATANNPGSRAWEMARGSWIFLRARTE